VRLVLVDNFVMPDGLDPAFFDVHPHLGLISLAAVAQQHGHQTVIYDPKREVRFGRSAYDRHFYRRAADDILRQAPDAVGFTTLGCSFLFAARVAELIRRAEPELPIMLGGPHATMLDRQILAAYRQFDIVVRHEAEETLPPLLAKLDSRAFETIPGITWRAGRRAGVKATPGLPKIEDLDRLPIPSYDLYPVRELGLHLMRVEAGRGCPFECTFCSTASFFQRSYRLKSPERLVQEMDILHARYGANEFKLDHDLFTVNRRKVRAFCDAVADRGYRWRVSARTDCVDEALLEKMALAGCIGLYFGIESGSKRMQQVAQKRLKLDGVDRILDVAANLGIETTVSFITGYPEETSEDQDATLDKLGACFARPPEACTPQLHILTPEPGTPLFAQHARSLAYDGYATKFNARILSEDDRAHILGHPDLYSTYYHYPAAMPRAHYTFAVDAVDALRAAGHDVLSYALRYYRGRLSALVADFRAWAWREQRDAPVTPETALAFIAERFGAGHHLTSLFRLGIAIDARKAGSDQGHPGKGEDFEQPYRVSPHSALFPQLHDCGRLLEQIRGLPQQAPPLSPEEAGDLTGYMVVVEGTDATHYRVDAAVEGILSLFQEPRSLRAAALLLGEMASVASVPESIFAQLIDIGALIPASNAHGRRLLRAS
jgi:radical SAM superfamily enzyme YgiQ (UPF0313 family)